MYDTLQTDSDVLHVTQSQCKTCNAAVSTSGVAAAQPAKAVKFNCDKDAPNCYCANCVLTDDDDTWRVLKHQHVVAAMDAIGQEVAKSKRTADVMRDASEGKSADALRAARNEFAALIDHGKLKASLRKHVLALDTACTVGEQERLTRAGGADTTSDVLPMSVFELEQLIVTGVDASGITVKPNKVTPIDAECLLL